MIRRWAPLMMAAMMVLAACQGTGVGETTTTESTMGPTTTTTVPAPSTLRVGVVGAASDLNWWAVWGSPGSDLDRARRHGATASLFTGSSLDPTADLALLPLGVPRPEGEHWVVDQKIAPDRRWDDGAPIVASDLVFYIEVVRSFSLDGLHVTPAGVVSVEAADDHTVRVRFADAPGPGQWPGEVGTAPFVPAHHWAPLLAGIGDRPALYDLVSPEPPRAGSPPVTWIEAESRHGAYELLVEGVVDLVHDPDGIDGLEPAMVDRLRDSDGTELTTNVRSPLRALAFNQRRPPFDDPVLRAALATVIDRGELATALEARPAYSFHDPLAERPAGPGTFDGERLDRSARVEAAVSMLSAAGYRWAVPPAASAGGVDPGAGLVDPDGSTVGPVQLLVSGEDPTRVDAARWISGRLADLGLEAEVVPVAAGDLAGAVLPPLTPEQARTWSLAVLGWRPTGPVDPGALLVHLFHSSEDSFRSGGTNVTGFADGEFDLLATRYSSTGSPGRAVELLARMELLLWDQVPQLPLYRETVTEAHRAGLEVVSTVDGLAANPSRWPFP